MSTPNNPFEQIIIPSSAPSAWPPAPIYWLILVLLIVVIGLTVFLIKRHLKKQKIIKQALSTLIQLQQKQVTFAQLNQLLKGVALQYYPREQVASLSGQAWFMFIQQHSKQKSQLLFEDKSTFCKRLYQQDSFCTEQDFITAKQWIAEFPAQLIQQQKQLKTGKKNVRV
ncbi:DUF4381 domain-containing protein [Psychromonas algarum]|uniref:DUF4381 domain-containing protein n=1 Tax=Psychromonas algarum TaxID=2555643 RepID=UPI00141914A8|nr:DUF4381 domain-containing protein [Psychromonas sp. RZ22]